MAAPNAIQRLAKKTKRRHDYLGSRLTLQQTPTLLTHTNTIYEALLACRSAMRQGRIGLSGDSEQRPGL